MKVKCRESRCYYCTKTDDCTLNEIHLDEDANCESFVNYSEASPLYQNRFYKHMRSKKDGHGCKKECFGKRIELFGLVFYTTDDDRYSPEDVGLTEEITGCYCGSLAEMTEKRCNEIKEKMSAIRPVKDEPDVDPLED